MKKDTEKEVKGWKLPVWNHLKTTSEWLQNSPVIPLSSEIEWFWLLPVQSGWNRGNIPSLSAFRRKGRFLRDKPCKRLLCLHEQTFAGQRTANSLTVNWCGIASDREGLLSYPIARARDRKPEGVRWSTTEGKGVFV